MQYQAWARGNIVIAAENTQMFALYTDAVIECWVDGEHHFGGDFYGFRRAPLVLWLGKGSHRLDLRLVRDVRAMGGIGAPSMRVFLKLDRTLSDVSVDVDHFLAADVVGGKLVSPFASFPVRNNSPHVVKIVEVSSGTVSRVCAYRW